MFIGDILTSIHILFTQTTLKCGFSPVGKIAEKAVCRVYF